VWAEDLVTDQRVDLVPSGLFQQLEVAEEDPKCQMPQGDLEGQVVADNLTFLAQPEAMETPSLDTFKGGMAEPLPLAAEGDPLPQANMRATGKLPDQGAAVAGRVKVSPAEMAKTALSSSATDSNYFEKKPISLKQMLSQKRFNPIAQISNQRGQTIIQALVSLGIMGITFVVLAVMFETQNRAIQSLKEKLARSDFQQQLIRSFSDVSLCAGVLNGLTFDSTNALASSSNQPTITLPDSSIPMSANPTAPALATAGQPLSPISTSVVAAPTSTFQLTNIVGASSGGAGNFNATFQVNLDGSSLGGSLATPSVQVSLQTTSVGSTQTISGCKSAGVPIGSRIATYTTTGAYSFTVPSGVYWLWVRVVGAGGGGGACLSAQVGGGGGSGGYSESWIAVNPGQVIPLTVGAGGPGGGWSGGSNDGSAGGSSSFGSMLATGGLGGKAQPWTTAGGLGGYGSGGQLNFHGAIGGDGSTSSNQVQGGHGGASKFGGGGRSADTDNDGESNGQAPGSGGGGAWKNQGVKGGNGQDGAIIISY
jgi:hypothetical protein